jgi:hypothetical protein
VGKQKTISIAKIKHSLKKKKKKKKTTTMKRKNKKKRKKKHQFSLSVSCMPALNRAMCSGSFQWAVHRRTSRRASRQAQTVEMVLRVRMMGESEDKLIK